MGFFSDTLGGIKDTFLGGSEDKAGEAAAKGNREAAKLYDRFNKDFGKGQEPYVNAGKTALKKYKRGSRVKGQTSKFNYSGEVPSFAPGGNSRLSKFAPTTEAPAAFDAGSGFSFSFDEFKNSDAYKTVMSEAMQAGERVLASQGKRGSGNRVIEMTKLAANTAGRLYGDEYQRQLTGSNENFNRSVTDANINDSRNDTSYNRELLDNQVNNQVASDMYGRDVAEHGFEVDASNTDYSRSLDRYSIRKDRNDTAYNRDQTRLSRLMDLVDMGRGADQFKTTTRLQGISGKANALVGEGNAVAAGEMGKANARRDTVGMAAKLYAGM